MDIEVDAKFPFKVGDASITKIVVGPISFMNYAECYRERIKEIQRTEDETAATKAFKRARKLKQITCFDKSGAIVPIDIAAMASMPRSLFVNIDSAIDQINETPGEVISKNGDGITIPLIYKLGKPFSFKNASNEEQNSVIELEFIAKTGGDIEGVLCADNNIEKTIMLLKDCATPIGDAGLQRLPSWMLDTLTVTDGFEILMKVLPVFLA